MATKTKRKTLAHVKKLSTLLAIGLRDLRKQERAKNSVVDMSEWLKQNGKCAACLGGSVLRFSLGCKPHRGFDVFPSDYISDSRDRRLIEALNDLRCGFVGDAANWLYVGPSKVPSRYMPDYDGPNGEWWKAMRQLLKDLKAAGE